VPGPGYRVPVDTEERLLAALAKAAHERLYEQGDVNLMLGEIEQIATEQGASDSIARHVLGQLAHQGLLTTDEWPLLPG
jgi:DNA-binding IscR family transcriptional regulator